MNLPTPFQPNLFLFQPPSNWPSNGLNTRFQAASNTPERVCVPTPIPPTAPVRRLESGARWEERARNERKEK